MTNGPVIDIRNRDDIARLVEAFYTRAFTDPVLGPIFIDIAQMDLEAHMPVMCDFWENILFRTGRYPGGLMMVHFQLHAKTPLLPEHFEIWLAYWHRTVDDLFTGERANLVKTHATNVAIAMSGRLNSSPRAMMPTSR